MMSQYLFVLFSAVLKQSSLPRDWLIAGVVPVHKSGDKRLTTSYRTISLASTCCKLLEHILANHITQFLESNNAFVNSQRGFRRRLSTTTILISVTRDFSLVINNNEQLDAISFDFYKVFNRVRHGFLIQKLHNVGVAPELAYCIEAYLRDRKQFVGIEHIGLLLGPLLFLVCVNDIATDLNSAVKVKLFADDCVIYSIVRSDQDQTILNQNLCILGDWCEVANEN